MKNSFSRAALCACILLAMASHAAAQHVINVGSRNFPHESPEIAAFDFPGGTLVEFVDLIREKVPEANFILTPDADQFSIPAMQLRDITVHQAAHLIATLAEEPNHGGRVSITSVGNVYAVRPTNGQSSDAATASDRSLVLSVADIVGDYLKPEDVLTSVETALAMFEDEYLAASIRYHDATKLLIARGREEQLVEISNVVDQLRDGMVRSNKVVQLEAVSRERDELRVQTAELEQQLRYWELQGAKTINRLRLLEEELQECRRELAECRRGESSDD